MAGDKNLRRLFSWSIRWYIKGQWPEITPWEFYVEHGGKKYLCWEGGATLKQIAQRHLTRWSWPWLDPELTTVPCWEWLHQRSFRGASDQHLCHCIFCIFLRKPLLELNKIFRRHLARDLWTHKDGADSSILTYGSESVELCSQDFTHSLV